MSPVLSSWEGGGIWIEPTGTNEQYGVCDGLTSGFDDGDCSLPEYSGEDEEELQAADLVEFGQGGGIHRKLHPEGIFGRQR